MKKLDIKRLDEYQLILFDMDGTLYFQRAMQIKMASLLLYNALFGKNGRKELGIVLKFRAMRENSLQNGADDEVFYKSLAAKYKITPQQAAEIIQKWIYQKPLQYLSGYRDTYLLDLLKNMTVRGIKTAIYSDYPPQDKQRILGIEAIPGFYGGQEEIDSFKPDSKGIRYIMEYFGISDKDKVLMIGDRIARDGRAAANADVDCLILKKYKFLRMWQYRKMSACFVGIVN